MLSFQIKLIQITSNRYQMVLSHQPSIHMQDRRDQICRGSSHIEEKLTTGVSSHVLGDKATHASFRYKEHVAI